MISSDHTTAEISHFLNKWFLTCKSIHGKSLKVAQIKVDYSWAMIHSVIATINNTNIINYLDNCLTYCTCNVQNTLNIRTVIHICSAHLLHNLSYILERKFILDKNYLKFILYTFGKIIKSYDFDEVGNIFKCFCKLLSSQVLTPEVGDNISLLDKYVKGEVIEQDIIESSIADKYSNVYYGSTYKDQSPFGRYFSSLYKDINTDSVMETDCSSSNLFYFLL